MAQAQNFSKHLLSHEIFKTSDEESSIKKRLSPPNSISSKRNQLCTRGNDLFIAVGNTVRCVNVSDSANNGYKNLGLELDFNIKELLMNETGSLMAIVGESQVAACVLPSSGAISGPDRILKVRCRQVGGVQVTDGSKVLKVAWNPIARYDSNLIVLTDDEFLRAYDLSYSYEHPEYAYSFQANQPKNEDSTSFAGEQSFSMDYGSVESPVSFALGTGSEPHGKMTLYVATRDGDVFGLCPWLPNQFVMSKAEIEDLFDNAVSQEYEYRRRKNPSLALKRHYKQQLSWASQLWKQMSHSMVETKLERDGTLYDLHIVQRVERPPPQPQGPFNYNPFPDQLYDGEAVDITTVDTGCMSAVLVSFTTGRVNIYLQDSSLDLKWQGSELDEQINLATLESVKLGHGANSKLRLYTDPKQELCVFALDGSSVFRLDLSTWALPLADAMDTGDIDQVKLALEQNSRSVVTNLLGKQDKTEVKGVCILEDSIGNQYSVTKSELGLWIEHWTERELDSRFSGSSTNNKNGSATAASGAASAVDGGEATGEKALLTNGTENLGSAELRYESLLRKMSLSKEIGDLLSNVQFQYPQRRLPTNSQEKIEPTLENLEQFSEIANFYTEELAKVQKAGLILHSRLASQRSELHRQLSKLGELGKKVEAIQENRAPQKLQETISRQADIQARSVKLLEKMSKARTLLLSDQEKKWFVELKRLQQKVYNNGGLDRRIKNAVVQADVILREVSVLDKESISKNATTSALEHDSIARLQTLLAKEGEVVESTKEHLKRLLSDVELDEGVERLGKVSIH